MNNIQSLYLLWATILNQSQNAEQVLNNTLELFNRLNLMESFEEKYKTLEYNRIEEAMTRKPCLHRFPKGMAINLASSIYIINQNYEGSPAKVFEDYEDTIEFRKKLLDFRGIGEHKADTAITIIQTYQRTNDVGNIFASKCGSLYRTIGQEMQILDELGDKIDYDR